MVKGNASGVIDEIIATLKHLRSKPPYKHHNDGFARFGFDYRYAYFMDADGKYYRLEFSVGINADNKEAYNIGKIREAAVPSQRLKGPKGTTTSTKRIPRPEADVKGKFAKDKNDIKASLDTEYLQLAQNPKQNEERLRDMVDEAAINAGHNKCRCNRL